jgi:hypothetical protein
MHLIHDGTFIAGIETPECAIAQEEERAGE